jgi:hypothetical protein
MISCKNLSFAGSVAISYGLVLSGYHGFGGWGKYCSTNNKIKMVKWISQMQEEKLRFSPKVFSY